MKPLVKQAAVKNSKKGFSLMFKSDKALEHLLAARPDTGMYLFAKNNYWQLAQKPSGRYRFLVSDAPDQVYDMEKSTVPVVIKQASHRIISVYGRADISFAVKLPVDMRRQISVLMKQGSKGGRLIIDETGYITMKEG